MAKTTNRDDDVDRGTAAQRWVPIIFLVAIGIAVILGIGALLEKESSAAPPPATAPATVPVTPHAPDEGDEQRDLDQYGQPLPQRVPVDVGVYPSTPGECSTKNLPRTDPFCSNLSDRALTDRHVADYMAQHAAHVITPGSHGAVAMDKDAAHWLRQVVATPVADGGPALEYESEFLAILDRWVSDDFTAVQSDWEWARSLLD